MQGTEEKEEKGAEYIIQVIAVKNFSNPGHRLVTDCIRRNSCVIQTGKSEFKSLYSTPLP